MSDIEFALKSLRSVHGKYQIAGQFTASNDSITRWPTNLPRSAEVDLLFREHDPVGVRAEEEIATIVVAARVKTIFEKNNICGLQFKA
ncbi:hypothetical protein [Pseudomonas sp. LFS044]|uniref:hypothetical protein n=1 Tax=Pseudomonas sp. LFS044 TaxID=3229880 RepID=UPI003A800651